MEETLTRMGHPGAAPPKLTEWDSYINESFRNLLCLVLFCWAPVPYEPDAKETQDLDCYLAAFTEEVSAWPFCWCTKKGAKNLVSPSSHFLLLQRPGTIVASMFRETAVC